VVAVVESVEEADSVSVVLVSVVLVSVVLVSVLVAEAAAVD
jgi:hypothetical protein